MATVTAVVYEHHQKSDGTFNVKFRVFHKGEKKFIDTDHFVIRRQLDSNFKIKDKFVKELIDDELKEHRRAISKLGSKLDFFSAETLRDYLRDRESDIDFIKFCKEHIQRTFQEGRKGTAKNHLAIKNSLVDYFRRPSISIKEITSNMLYSYERFLRSERTMIRINQLGKEVTTVEQPMKDAGIHNHMRDLRTLFNEACREYNNPDLGLYKINHYPFKVYKIGSAPLTQKRNLHIEQILKIRDCKAPEGSRTELARDLFMLSFYLCGINAVDIYNLPEYDSTLRRIEYCRSKTKSIRRDGAFISICIVEEAVPLLKKYAGRLKARYSTHNGLDTALSKGMKELRKIIEIDYISFYWARHSFANLARNKCRLSKDDVGLALNHVDHGHQTTDIYVEKDWTIVDEVQSMVLKLLEVEKDSNKSKPAGLVKPLLNDNAEAPKGSNSKNKSGLLDSALNVVEKKPVTGSPVIDLTSSKSASLRNCFQMKDNVFILNKS